MRKNTFPHFSTKIPYRRYEIESKSDILYIKLEIRVSKYEFYSRKYTENRLRFI